MWFKYLNVLLIEWIFAFDASTAASIIEDVESYETIHPRYVHDKSSYSNQDRLKLIIPTKTKEHILHLERNRFLVPKNFRVYSQGKHDLTETQISYDQTNCFYHGKIEGEHNSRVSFSNCGGRIEGYFVDGSQKEFHLARIENKKKEISHILYNKLKPKKNRSCGAHGRTPIKDETNGFNHSSTFLSRTRRGTNLFEQMKYIETVIVADYEMYKKYSKDKRETVSQLLAIMNHNDEIYKTINTRTPVSAAIVVDDPNFDGFKVFRESAGSSLSSFERYAKQELHTRRKLGLDNAVLVSGINFDGSVVGLAGVGSMCTYSSSSINQDHSNPKITANTVAHEMGHNLGMTHIDGRCKCENGPCVMSSFASHEQVKSFASCSISQYKANVETGKFPCLFDYPDVIEGDPKCGNMYLEKGEECDCGSESECKRTGAHNCCNSTTCKLKRDKGAQCAFGPCCNIETCIYHKQGYSCRNKQSICDLPESCNGTSSQCPTNTFAMDGTACTVDDESSYCYAGLCKSYASQCKVLYGDNALKSPPVCLNLNKNGDEFANCGKNEKGEFLKCNEEDVGCGKLHCSGSIPRFPIVGSNKKVRDFFIGSITCKQASMTMGPEDDDPTQAGPGIKCGENKVCSDKKCTDITVDSEVLNQTCANGGVINNLRHCHCMTGYACPDCIQVGMGGSIDSGQGCTLGTGASESTGRVYGIVLGLLIPTLALIFFLLYRQRRQIGEQYNRFRGRHKMEIRNMGVSNTGADVPTSDGDDVFTRPDDFRLTFTRNSKLEVPPPKAQPKRPAPPPPVVMSSIAAIHQEEAPPPDYTTVVSGTGAEQKSSTPVPTSNNKPSLPPPPSLGAKANGKKPTPLPKSKIPYA